MHDTYLLRKRPSVMLRFFRKAACLHRFRCFQSSGEGALPSAPPALVVLQPRWRYAASGTECHSGIRLKFEGQHLRTLGTRSDLLCHSRVHPPLHALHRALAHLGPGTRRFWRGRGSCLRGEGLEPGDGAKTVHLVRVYPKWSGTQKGCRYPIQVGLYLVVHNTQYAHFTGFCARWCPPQQRWHPELHGVLSCVIHLTNITILNK